MRICKKNLGRVQNCEGTTPAFSDCSDKGEGLGLFAWWEQNQIVALFGARRPAFRYQLLHYYFQKLHDISTFPHQSQTYAQIKFKGNPFFSRSMIEWLSFKLTVRFKSFNMCYSNEFETRSSQGRLKWRWIRRSSGFGQDIYWDVSLWLSCKIWLFKCYSQRWAVRNLRTP